MDDATLLRYARLMLLPQVGVDGQERLLRARVLIVGLGGLGTPAALYLATSGIGELVLADGDTVDLTNLPRQILYREADVGRLKAEQAAHALRLLNPGISVIAHSSRLAGSALEAEVRAASVVVDASDNFSTRFALNAACVASGTPLVSGAVIRMEGQITVFRRDLPGSACYRCLYAEGQEDDSCVRTGVLAPAAGLIGCMQALETMKIVAGFGQDLNHRLLLLDAASSQWREIRLRKDPGCPVCGNYP